MVISGQNVLLLWADHQCPSLAGTLLYMVTDVEAVEAVEEVEEAEEAEEACSLCLARSDPFTISTMPGPQENFKNRTRGAAQGPSKPR